MYIGTSNKRLPGMYLSARTLWRVVLKTRLLASLIILSIVAASVTSSASPIRAAEEILMPFPAGYAIKIIQGYHGGTHQGVERYSLDLVVANGATSGAPVTAPVSGRIDWAYGPWVRNGCLAILLADGSGLGVMLCHVIFDRTFGSGEAIWQGQRLGYVGPAGTVGNNGTPHVHMQLYAGGRGARTPLPFAYPSGRPLNGVSLPDTGRYNAHGGVGPISSGNTGGTGQGTTAGQDSATALPTPRATPAPTSPPRTPPAAEPSTDAAGSGEPARSGGAAERVNDAGTASSITRAEADERTVTGGTSSRGAAAAPAESAQKLPGVVRVTAECLNVREEPSLQAKKVDCLPDGTQVTIVDGPVRADNRDWYRLEDSGWAVGDYLVVSGE